MKSSFIIILALLLLNYLLGDESEKVNGDDARNATAFTKNENVKEIEDDPDVFNKINGYRVRSEMELELIPKIIDLTVFKFVYKPSSANSRRITKLLIPISEKLKDLAAIALIDCETFIPADSQICKEYDYSRDSFPRMRLLLPPEIKYDHEKKKLQPYSEVPWTETEINESTIYNFISSNIPNKATKLDHKKFPAFVNNDYFNKVILFTNKHHQSVLWRGLTTYFYDRILMGEVLHTDKGLVEQFNVTKYPTLFIYKTNDPKRLIDEPEIIKYEEQIDTDKIIQWIEPHATREKRYSRWIRGINDNNILEASKELSLETVTNENYTALFEKYSNKNILLFFNTKNNPKLSVKEFCVFNHPFFFSYFFNCHDNQKFCLEKFGITKFPMMKMLPKQNENNTLTLEDRIRGMKVLNITKNGTKSLDDQVREMVTSRVKYVHPNEFPYIISEAKFTSKFIFADFYRESDVTSEFVKEPLALDLLSADDELYKTYDYIRVYNPHQELIGRYQLPKIPGTYIFWYPGSGSIEFRPFLIDRSSFYSTYESLAKAFIYQKTMLMYKYFESSFIPEIKDQYTLKMNCYFNEKCAIAFLDGRDLNETSSQIFLHQIMQLEQLSKDRKYEQIKFAWINATCHSYLADAFGIKEYPSLVYYTRYNDHYSDFNGLWETRMLINYIDRCMEGRVTLKEITSDRVNIQHLNCMEVENDDEDTEQPDKKEEDPAATEKKQPIQQEESKPAEKASEMKDDL